MSNDNKRFKSMITDLFVAAAKENLEKKFNDFERDCCPFFVVEIRFYGTDGRYVYAASMENDQEKRAAFVDFVNKNTPGRMPEDIQRIMKVIEESGG